MASSAQPSPRISTGVSLQHILRRHLLAGDAVGLWRIPGETRLQLIACPHEARIASDSILRGGEPGFIIAPFAPEQNSSFLSTKKSPHYCFKAEREPRDHPIIPFHTAPRHATPGNLDKRAYICIVEKALDFIATGQAQKIVLARKQTASLDHPIRSPLDLFYTLCARYTHAFISLISTPAWGSWIGASPELLIHADKGGRLKTVALAGTQTLQPRQTSEAMTWQAKDIREQALVSAYIAERLHQAGITHFTQSAPYTGQAGNLVHLKTDFTASLPPQGAAQALATLLRILHPTSAVCGSPREAALRFLAHNESFDRRLYSGYIGPVNIDGETRLYVNLRCMQWENEAAMLYAGAGIIAESVPEKEWGETEVKMNTLRDVMSN